MSWSGTASSLDIIASLCLPSWSLVRPSELTLVHLSVRPLVQLTVRLSVLTFVQPLVLLSVGWLPWRLWLSPLLHPWFVY